MELIGMSVSTGFAAGLRARAARLISQGGFLKAVKQILATAPVVHADETFARAEGGTAYVHVAPIADRPGHGYAKQGGEHGRGKGKKTFGT